MPRGPGRDGKIATQRQLRLLTRLAQAMPQWVNRDELAAELFPGAKAPRDAIARDKRALLAVGWNLEQRRGRRHGVASGRRRPSTADHPQR